MFQAFLLLIMKQRNTTIMNVGFSTASKQLVGFCFKRTRPVLIDFRLLDILIRHLQIN